MGAKFFIGWQTWEMLSFVLACAIVCVFAFGLGRLWYTNRKIERLELIDEERRVRLAEMRHCGIDTRAVNDIPFGVRAIQSGIEVEGIWISRPNTPEASKRNSAATLVAGSVGSNKGKGKAVDPAGLERPPRRLGSLSAAGSSEQTLRSSPLARGGIVPSEYPAQVAVEESDPFVQQGRPGHRSVSSFSGLTGAESYFDNEGARPQHQLADAYHQSWETSSQTSQPYDSGSSSEGAPGQGHQTRPGYSKLQRTENPYTR
ncbi:hypothetical protein ESCO_000991 [Escovopsis weberi]|uniref:Uncharacterized protein n=1 Tax=Escovopsis weberi TaxID=150374 RepID=A0A0M8N3I8_ESCWE|nr:hypothetical protein ESCO_000991 [Escovopsis weberi]